MTPSPRLALLSLLLLAMAAAAFWPATEAEPVAPAATMRAPAAVGPLAMAWLDGPADTTPPAPVITEAAAETGAEPGKPRPDWPYEVLGVLHDARGWRAFLAHEGQALTVRSGDRLQGWRVLDIDGRQLLLRTTGGTQRRIELPRMLP